MKTEELRIGNHVFYTVEENKIKVIQTIYPAMNMYLLEGIPIDEAFCKENGIDFLLKRGTDKCFIILRKDIMGDIYIPSLELKTLKPWCPK